MLKDTFNRLYLLHRQNDKIVLMAIPKKYLLLVILLFVFCKASFAQATIAQTSIIPQISEAYMKRLVDTAIAHFPRVRYFEHRVEAATNNVAKTKASWFDALTLSYVYQPGTTVIDPTNPKTSYFRGLQAGVFLNVGALIAKPYAIKQAIQDKLVTQSEQEEYLVTLSAEVRRRYLLYLQRVAELKLQVRAASDSESQLRDVKYRFEKGEDTFDSYSKVLIQVTEHQQTMVQTEANVFISKSDVEELLGTKLENVK